MFASIPMLAYGVRYYSMDILRIIFLSILTLYSGFFAALIWNDITDVNIDNVAHPDRPIPSGKISSKKFFGIALIFSAMTFVFAFSISMWCLFIVGMSALFVTFHDKYFKKKVKFPAYSELFTPVQWIITSIFGFFAIWTVIPQTDEIFINSPFLGFISTSTKAVQQMIFLIVFTYFADISHDIAEGIHDFEGDLKNGVRTFATSFGKKNAAQISFVMLFISGIFGIILFITTILTIIFLVPFLCLWFYTILHAYKMIKTNKDDIKNLSKIIGRKEYNYFIFSYNLIVLDIVIQVIYFYC
jgi:geranylgeranylglycerol-phosphate geranylgeranyltransferase